MMTMVPHVPSVGSWDASVRARVREQADDAQRLRWSLLGAALAHGALLLVTLPSLEASDRVPPGESRPVYVVREVRFKPRPPDPPPVIPQRQPVLVPVPDPTPDDPEPLPREEVRPFEVAIDGILTLPAVAPPPPRPPAPVRVTGEIRPPERVFSPSPVYTEVARAARLQGIVILDAVIETDGSVTDVSVLRGLPLGLSEAAVDAVSRWKFRPATLNDRPVAVIYTLTIYFELR